MTVDSSEALEKDILDQLQSISYTNLDECAFNKAIDGGANSVEFTSLVSWISKELQYFCKLDDHINPIDDAEDSSSFLLELSSFLKELGCPYENLTSGSVKERLQTCYDRLLLLDYLITELQAAKMTVVNYPDEGSIKLTINESPTAASLKKMLIALNVPKPPENITCTMLFSKLQSKVQENSAKLISDPLFQGVLTEKEWSKLDQLHKDFLTEYRIRRELLLKRLDVTIQSFQWSEKTKGKENDIALMYTDRRKQLLPSPQVSLADLLAARKHLAVIEKTSNANVRKHTKSSINKVIIGKVPDRGGRPSEQQPPPPEMPSWAPRAQDTGRGGRGGGRGGGGRVQGGWNQGGNQGGGYQGGRDNYQGGRDNFQGGRDNFQGGRDNYQGGRDNYQGGGRGGRRGRY